jgi:hypothetical protein
MARALTVALLCAAAAAGPAPCLAQTPDHVQSHGPWRGGDGADAPLGRAWEPALSAPGAPWSIAAALAIGAERQGVRSPPSPTTAALLSLALPGAGQHLLGQRRKWLYVAVEIAGWALWAERRSSAADYEDAYRDFAWDVGRIQTGPREDGDFDYYERMSKWTRSGAFDADPATSSVQPELDGATYNGSVWALATDIYIPPGTLPPETDPAYQSALDYYELRAYGSEFLWDWPTAADQQELGRLIGESDDRYGQATTMMGVVIANHLFSAVDAYLSARGRAAPARLRVLPAWSRSPVGHRGVRPDWHIVLSVGVGR